jgi:vitamin B12 transporter
VNISNRVQSILVAAAAVNLIIPLTTTSTQAGETSPEDNIVITANRTPMPSSRVIAPFGLIDADTIERSMATDLSELLRFQSGLDIARLGGPGQQTSIFTRGTNSNHTLVLIDGVRINTGGLGLAAIQNITPEIIERVEIVKSTRSTLYGENAIGGVINVITRDADGPNVQAFGGGGQDDMRKLGLAGGTTAGAFSISGRIQHLKTDGYSIVEGVDYDSGWDNTTVEAKAGLKFERWDLEARVWNSEGTTEYVGFSLEPRSQDYQNQMIALAAGSHLANNWDSVVDLSFVKDEINQNELELFVQNPGFIKTERTLLDWQNTVRIDDNHTLVAGFFFSHEEVDGISFDTPLNADDVDTWAVYAQDSMEFGRHSIVLAGRFSDNDAFGNSFTWNAEYGFDATDKLRLTTSAGRAVRAPLASERFGCCGNPNLREEDAITVDAGLQWQFSTRQNLSLGIFATQIDDLIASSGPPTYELGNIQKVKIKGIEAGYHLNRMNWSLSANGILQDPENKTDGTTLLRRSKKSATVSASRNFGAHQVGADMRFVGSRPDVGGATAAGYGLINLTGRLAFSKQWSLNGRIENLFDRDYTPAYKFAGTRYLAPGRGAYIELRYRMQ